MAGISGSYPIAHRFKYQIQNSLQRYEEYLKYANFLQKRTRALAYIKKKL